MSVHHEGGNIYESLLDQQEQAEENIWKFFLKYTVSKWR